MNILKTHTLSTYWEKVLSVLFPTACYACKAPLVSQSICDACAHEIELIDPFNRCPLCFNAKPSCTSSCAHCFQHPAHPRVYGQACCLFESFVLTSLLSNLQSHLLWEIDRALASLAYVQLDRLGWPAFDLLVLEPSHWLLPNKKILALSHRIGKELAKLLAIPYTHVSIDPTTLLQPTKSLEYQPWTHELFLHPATKDLLHGKNILTFCLNVSQGTTWKALSHALESCGLVNIWNLGLCAQKNSWIDFA